MSKSAGRSVDFSLPHRGGSTPPVKLPAASGPDDRTCPMLRAQDQSCRNLSFGGGVVWRRHGCTSRGAEGAGLILGCGSSRVAALTHTSHPPCKCESCMSAVGAPAQHVDRAAHARYFSALVASEASNVGGGAARCTLSKMGECELRLDCVLMVAASALIDADGAVGAAACLPQQDDAQPCDALGSLVRLAPSSTLRG
eukprot:CAMPEP_0181173708 /NCGR_PEP_ID=MMETSP1096-20121128/3145_1 /TAXON_ID=156174 ORGANISM="Chrysochromulina ericina, Strain CCMP281" /NCGR_SAMPLE_ID=MMETSP1096 /ASSEMBLY_ACC=CAM_ASM_000453 /LENGTH=197 /DNA_ID=CAMNT_0023261557 /DNA_START=219 /DNA_END=812 /DNA_ORIENTATION=+